MIRRDITSKARALFSCSGIVILCFLLLTGCKKKTGESLSQLDSATVRAILQDGDPLDQVIPFEVTEDKHLTASYYDREELKEWYIKRVLPPPFDFTMDLTGKNYLELRLLRNEIFARNGYLFKDASLRVHFNAFDWYQPIFDVPEFKVQISAQEKAFLDRVIAREVEELRKRELSVQGNAMVSMDYLVNPGMFPPIEDSLRSALQSMNMAVVPATHAQLFSVYDENQYLYVPNFITSDLFLQVMHKYHSSLLKNAEDSTLTVTVRALLDALHGKAKGLATSTSDERIRRAAAWAETYLSIAVSVLSGARLQATGPFMGSYEDEVRKITESHGLGSGFLRRSLFDYSQFTPRGNYTDTEDRKRYFRCMKWLNSAPMNLGDDPSFAASLLIALWINEDEGARTHYATLHRIVTCFAGEEDGLSLNHVSSVLRQNQITTVEKLFSAGQVEFLKKQLQALDVSRINPKGGIQPAQEELSQKAVLFTAGRYSLDADVLSRMIHVERPDPKRPFPKGLDVFAALGNRTAESILNDTYHESQQWPAFSESLTVVKGICQKYDRWNAALFNRTLDCILALGGRTDHELPLFMRTQQWQEKNLVTSLAAWAELKHDMILYSEQPYAAEAGEGGGPEPPVHLSYVEPNIPFWSKAVDLLAYQDSVLSPVGALSEDARVLNHELKELAGFLLAVSKKEIAKERLTTKEFNELSWIGGKIEGITFRVLGTDHLPERENQIALVTDVYSYNGIHLEEAVGHGDEIYVIAEINGLPYLTRGACFSYYEFQSERPLTDEAWQTLLSTPGCPQRPAWTKRLCVQPAKSFEKWRSNAMEFADHH
jgi:hypothetical protein